MFKSERDFFDKASSLGDALSRSDWRSSQLLPAAAYRYRDSPIDWVNIEGSENR